MGQGRGCRKRWLLTLLCIAYVPASLGLYAWWIEKYHFKAWDAMVPYECRGMLADVGFGLYRCPMRGYHLGNRYAFKRNEVVGAWTEFNAYVDCMSYSNDDDHVLLHGDLKIEFDGAYAAFLNSCHIDEAENAATSGKPLNIKMTVCGTYRHHRLIGDLVFRDDKDRLLFKYENGIPPVFDEIENGYAYESAAKIIIGRFQAPIERR